MFSFRHEAKNWKKLRKITKSDQIYISKIIEKGTEFPNVISAKFQYILIDISVQNLKKI